MHQVKMIVPPLLRKNVGTVFTILAMASAMTTSALADGSSTSGLVSDALPANNVVATVTVGSYPYGFVVSPDNSMVYVANSGSNNVSVIDATTNTLKTTITVGTYPEFAAVTPDGKSLYVTNYGDATVSVISTASNAVTNTLDVGLHPQGIAVTLDGKEVFVADYDGLVSVIDTATNGVSSIAVPGSPYWIAFSPSGKQAYVVNSAVPGFISVIDVVTQTVSAKILGGGEIYAPLSLAVAPSGTLYVSDYQNYVAAISPAGVLKKAALIVPTIDVAKSYYMGQSVVTPNDKYVYAANYSSNNVVMFSAGDLKQVGQPITTGNEPAFMAVAPNGKTLYVGNYLDASVTVVNIAP